jgi:armadillo repeat-containing protein 3
MCSDYSTKSQVLSLNVLPALIRLIGETDPDLKFNALSTIDRILDDYNARSLARELNAIEPILNNLKSDYPQITETVCNCLQKLATDPLNRAAIRELAGLDRMIDFIGLSDTKDAHVHCLNALANLLEDTECLDVR